MSASTFLDTILPAPAPADYRYIWAKVTQVSPLRIQVDGDRDPLPITPDDLGGGPRPLNQRVYCQILNRRLVVLGPVVFPAVVDPMPAGAMLEFGGSTAPAGYLMADGAAVSRTTYAALYAALGGASSPWGQGNGSTTFNVPNRKGRVGVGRDAAQAEFDVLGETGGAKTHTLTAAEMPIHTHVQDSHNHTQNSHSHGTGGTTSQSSVPVNSTIVLAGSNPSGGSHVNARGTGSGTVAGDSLSGSVHSHDIPSTTAVNQAATATNQDAGGGGAHNNLQPYVVVNYIVKT